ncbi:MAG: 4Fe-4S dicluster domain-containing protein [Desulfobacteraceae bacterium]|nr:MAG: 4Fe-4S dicluster domain-containing protein [Desulfobacteraceae bacterium]
MEWTKDAEKAIQKVPFFVRKKVKARVEEEAKNDGSAFVSLSHVKTVRQRFLTNMSAEIKGYQVDACFSDGGCPNAIFPGGIQEKIEVLLKKKDLLGFLKNRVKGEIRFHHEFKITVSDCPNACSRPQIKDIGIIAAKMPQATDTPCTGCMECVNICKESAIQVNDNDQGPQIDLPLCVGCGQCICVCPTGSIKTDKQGYRVLLGGKLGRHPRLASELPGIFTENETLAIVARCIDYYKSASHNGERFADLMARDETLLYELSHPSGK